MNENDAGEGALVALVFDDPYKADEARAALHRMSGEEGLLEIDETAVIVPREGGKARVTQDLNVVARDQQIGHLLGLIAAAVTGTMPFILGATLAGRLVGRLTDHGVTNQFIGEVKKRLRPGTSALLLYARSDPERRRHVVERLRPFGAALLDSGMPAELRQALEDDLAACGGAPKAGL